MNGAGALAAVFVALYAAHQVGGHWVQTDWQAQHKGGPGIEGRLACAGHVVTYTLTQLVSLTAVAVVTGLRCNAWLFVAGMAVSAVTHYAADRREPLKRLALATTCQRFWFLGAPREGRDDNPSLGTGAYALDQSWHVGWLFVSALIIAGGAT